MNNHIMEIDTTQSSPYGTRGKTNMTQSRSVCRRAAASALVTLICATAMPTLVHAQTWQAGTGSIYVNPTTTKVGIGTTSPSTGFHMKAQPLGGNPWVGQLLIEPVNDGYDAAISLKTTETTTDRIWTILAGYQGTPASTNFRVFDSTAGLDRLNIDSNGYVGIGTITPTEMLQIGDTSTSSTSRRAISLGSGGFAAPSAPNSASSGDKLVLWNTSGYKAAVGLNSGTLTFQSTGNSAGIANIQFFTGDSNSPVSAMLIDKSGNVGIGTTAPQHKLAVNGTIGAKEVKVTNTGWSDYVFKPDYRLKPLNEVGAYIKEHGHLPEIPSEKEVSEKGVSLGEMQAKLLAKIEELTLHMIQADERNNQLEQQNKDLQARITRLESSQPPSASR